MPVLSYRQTFEPKMVIEKQVGFIATAPINN